jgi:hypothetical protein
MPRTWNHLCFLVDGLPSRKRVSRWILQMLGSENPIPPRDRVSRVNAINKAEFIELASQGQAPHRHTGPIGQTRPRASLGRILYRSLPAVTAKARTVHSQ